MAANRVMSAISGWIERKLFLKVNATKSKVIRPMRSKYLGFTFLRNGGEWKVKPTNEKKAKLYQIVRKYLKRGKAIARPLAVTIKRINQIVVGWINYYRIGMNVVNYILNPTLLETKIKDGAGLPMSFN